MKKIKYGVYGLLDSRFVHVTDSELPAIVGHSALVSQHETLEAAMRAAGLASPETHDLVPGDYYGG